MTQEMFPQKFNFQSGPTLSNNEFWRANGANQSVPTSQVNIISPLSVNDTADQVAGYINCEENLEVSPERIGSV